jgi:DedD protein
MARSLSEEELQLKKRARRRLIGAVVLVTAVAVILPMVLDSEPQPAGDNVAIHIPPPDAAEFKAPPTATRPDRRAAPPEPASGEPGSGEMKELPPPGPSVRAPDESTSKPTTADKGTVPAAKERAAPVERVQPSAGSYVVQVAALSDRAKAKELEKRMAAAGVRAYTEVVAVESGEVTRVRAGPYATREAAEKAREQLRKAGFDGRVVAR